MEEREDLRVEAFYVAFPVLRLQNRFIFREILFRCFLCKFENWDNQDLQNFTRDQCIHTGYKINSRIVITACKRNLGQGNVFTSVCHSVKGVPPRQNPPDREPLDRDPPPLRQRPPYL